MREINELFRKNKNEELFLVLVRCLILNQIFIQVIVGLKNGNRYLTEMFSSKTFIEIILKTIIFIIQIW